MPNDIPAGTSRHNNDAQTRFSSFASFWEGNRKFCDIWDTCAYDDSCFALRCHWRFLPLSSVYLPLTQSLLSPCLRFALKMSARGPSRKKKLSPVDLSPEMDECLQILLSIMQKEEAAAFNEPVDWETLGLPDYPSIIKSPMDLGTIQVMFLS